jgi:phosphoserine phosphatase
MSNKNIEDLRRELSSLKESRDSTNSEARKWVEKRNSALEQIKKFRVEISVLREKRDALNKEVQDLKVLREQAKKMKAEKQKEISTMEERIRPIIRNKPQRDMEGLQKEIEEIDWKIQTTLIPLKDEKYLVDQVKVLETQLSAYKQLQKAGKQITELRTVRESFEGEARLHHEKLSALASESQKIHEEMINTVKGIRALQDEANAAHQSYLEARQRSAGLHQKYLECLSQVKSAEQGIRETQDQNKSKTELEAKEKLNEAREKLKKRSLEKLKQKERLTWEEFQILAEDGML